MKAYFLFLKSYMLQRLSKIITLAVLLFCAISVFYATFSPSGPLGVTSNTTEVEVYFPEGARSMDIAYKMVDEGVLSHAYGFILRAKLLKKLHKLQAGEYLIPPGMRMEQLIDKIASGDVIHRSISVPEGVTVAEVVKKLDDNALLEGEIKTIPPEGSLLPATYPYHRGEKRENILKRMQKAMDQTLSELWKERSKDCPLKSPQEAVILASIIEKETSQKVEEQPIIAGVFYNRLATKMKLQSDPTVIYGLTLGKKQLGRPLAISDLTHNSPFNTYKHFGLPPAPIACPGKGAIKAVLCPKNTDAIFFVANGTGGHSFAKTLADHNKNVQKWRQICSARREQNG